MSVVSLLLKIAVGIIKLRGTSSKPFCRGFNQHVFVVPQYWVQQLPRHTRETGVAIVSKVTSPFCARQATEPDFQD
jgi:hypothetical protein